MTQEELLRKYQNKHPEIKEIEAWQFGDDPDTLADLTLKGIKTATCSCKAAYGKEDVFPTVNDLSIILNTKNEAVCIIQNTRVYECRYKDITAAHAYKEGEGERTLAYWQKVHWTFFTQDSQKYKYEFNEESILICEEFEVIMKGESDET